MIDVGNFFTPEPEMTREINWLQYHKYRHLEYEKTARNIISTSNGRTLQNRKLTFPHGRIVYSQEIQDAFSILPFMDDKKIEKGILYTPKKI